MVHARALILRDTWLRRKSPDLEFLPHHSIIGEFVALQYCYFEAFPLMIEAYTRVYICGAEIRLWTGTTVVGKDTNPRTARRSTKLSKDFDQKARGASSIVVFTTGSGPFLIEASSQRLF